MKRKVIAITGKIGSGKSAVLGILRDMGCKTVDCDELSRQISDKIEVVNRVERLLGAKSVVDGKLNRKYIREKVFADEKLLREYEKIFFDGVKALLTDKLASLQDEKAVFVEIPVLDAFHFEWDEVWRVETDEQNSISRVVSRDGVSADNVRATLGSQKAYDCTCVIVNNGDMEQLRQTVHTILCQNRLT